MPDYWDQFAPADNNQDYWNQFQPADSGNNDYWGQFKEEKPDEQSWLDWGITTGLRTAFPVAGSILGGIGGAALGGVGALPGTMAGGAVGGGIGEAAAQWYEGKGFNPWSIGVEAGLGAIPLMGGKTPGLGSSLKEVGAYALRGAGEGAFMGGVGAVPRTFAQTGEYPTWQEVGSQALGGAAFGGLTSGVLGAGNVVREHYTPRLQKIADASYGEPITGDLFGANDMPINRSIADLPPIGGTSVYDNKPYVPPIEGTPSPVGPRPVAPTDVAVPPTFNTGQIDPQAYMTLMRQLKRPPSMAEIEAFQVGKLDNALTDMIGGQERMGRNQQEIDAWEETPDDAFRGGPVGVVRNEAPHVPISDWEALPDNQQPPPVNQAALEAFHNNAPWQAPVVPINKDRFSDEEARRIVDRAFPPPAPEQPLDLSPNALDEEARLWFRNQDKIIGDYQAQGGRLMEDEWGPITPGHAESLLPRPTPPQQLSTGGIQVPGGELLPAEAKQSEFERLFGLQPGEQMSDAEVERIKEFYAKQLRDMYGTDVVEGQRASDEALGILGDEKLHYPELGDDDEPRFAKVKGGGLAIDVDNRRAGVNLTKDYTTELSGIMAREAIQNALDAVKDLGSGGRVHVRTLNKARSSNTAGEPSTIEVYDNGKGLDETGLAEKLVRLFATGKENEAGATGGKGIGSASYILGGQHFQIETVAVDSKDGKKYRIIAGGTPDQFYDTEQGSDWSKKQVPMSTPTGTKIRVKLTENQELYNTNQMIDKILHHSRDREAKILRDAYGFSEGTDISAITPETTYNDVTENVIGSTSVDKIIGQLNYNDSDITVGVTPHNGKDRSHFEVHYLNNGMYQFSETKYVDKKMKGVPEHVIVNVKPQMDEQDDNYPFINTREDVKKNMRKFVDDFIEKNVTGPAIDRRKNRTQELYDSMPLVNIPGTARKTVIYDPGERLTPEEQAHITNSPLVHAMVQHWDGIIDNILSDTARTKWADRLEGVGLVLDPNMHGVHIPNPSTKKSTILINPFIRAEQGLSPADNAFDNTITAIHEVAHIGDETGSAIDPTPMEMDMSDPRYAKFYQSYFQQVRDHGDVGWTNTGHGVGFIQRLGEVYAKVGAANTFDAADGLEHIFSEGSGEYTPEFQELLRIYTESRGRAETTEDLLSGTGVKQSNTGNGGEGEVPSDAGLLGGGIIRAIDPNAVAKAEGFQRIAATTGDARLKKAADEIYLDQAANITLEFLKNHGYAAFNKLMSDERGAINIPAWKDIKKAAGWGQGRNSPALNRAVFKYIDEALSASKNIVTVGDVSFPGRQGLGAIGTQQFWGAIYNMFGGMTQAGYDRIDAEIRKLPAFRPGPLNPRTGQRGPSFAEQIGVDLYTQPSKAGAHHHSIASRWLETGEFLGPAAPLWRDSPAGKWFRASNRVNLTFMNYLRANRLQYMLDRAQDMSLSALQGNKVRPNIWGQQFDISTQAGRDEAMALDPYRNLPLAREIADSVRTMTGGAPLRTHALPLSGTELSGEPAAGIFNRIFFSPGLMASRVRTLNPSTYIMATPQVRRNYLQTLLGTAMGWTAGLGLMKMYYGDEAQIGTDPRSADFGKAVIGDFRVDPGASNQQWLVLAARIASGTPVSSSTNREYRLGEGFNATTAWDLGVNFLGNKLEPTAKLAFDMARASGYQPVHMKDRTMQLFIPLVAQDLIELSKKRPDLAPMALASFFGMGTQIYDRGASESKFFDPKDDWLYQGGGLQGLIQGTNFRGPDDTSRASRTQSRSRASRGSGRSSTR